MKLPHLCGIGMSQYEGGSFSITIMQTGYSQAMTEVLFIATHVIWCPVAGASASGSPSVRRELAVQHHRYYPRLTLWKFNITCVYSHTQSYRRQHDTVGKGSLLTRFCSKYLFQSSSPDWLQDMNWVICQFKAWHHLITSHGKVTLI